MTLRIYGIPRSRAFRPIWAAEECGIPYEVVPIDFRESAKEEAFLAVNPMGKVPAIDDGGFVLTESLAITTYLVKRHGPALAPRTPEEDAKTLQWTLWGATEIERPLIDFVGHRHVLPPDRRDESVAREAESKLPRPLACLDARLGKSAHLLGEDFGLADLNVSSLLYTAWFNKAGTERWPHVHAWLDRCFARPAAQRARKLRE